MKWIAPVFGNGTLNSPAKIPIEGKEIMTLFIGRGRHTAAYFQKINCVYLFVYQEDASKEILSDTIKNKHIPTLKYIEYNEKLNCQIYKTQWYWPIDAKHKDWPIIKTLKKLLNEASDALEGLHPKEVIYCGGSVDYNRRFVDLVAKSKTVPQSIKTAIKNIEYSMSNYDSYVFDDFSKRNIRQDVKGNLVFIDPVHDYKFSYELIQSKRGY